MDFDTLLTRHVGEMGCFQRCFVLSTAFVVLGIFCPLVELIFQGILPPYTCEGEKLESVTPGIDSLSVRSEAENNMSVSACTQCEFNSSEIGYTIAERFGLVCDREWLLTLTQSFAILGFITGVFVAGWTADRLGRKPVLVVFHLVTVASRVGSAVAHNYPLFVTCRVLSIGSGFGFYTVVFILAMELVGKSWRSKVGMLSMCGFGLAYLSTSLAAYLTRDYRYTILVNSVWLLPYFLYYCYAVESPRWLLAAGHTDRGFALLQRITAVNKGTFPDLKEIELQIEKKSTNPLTLFKSPEMRKRTTVNIIIWFIVSMSYYGLMLNSANLPGSIYLNVVYLGIGDLLAWLYPQFALDVRFLGRRRNISGTIFLGGICLLVIIPIPKRLGWVSLVLYVAGKLSLTAAFNMLYVHTPETMPTELRALGFSVPSTAARVGSFVAVYVALLGQYHATLPSALLGGLSVMTSLLVFLLPETLGKPLPDTVHQVELQGRKYTPKQSQADNVVCQDVNNVTVSKTSVL